MLSCISKDRRRVILIGHNQGYSVIPYRYNKGKLEILLISSSKNNHYVVPKGIKEAAGIKGKIAVNPIDSYTYEKWEATCTVTVNPMKVTHRIDEKYREEKHRGREWVKPNMAAKNYYSQL